MGEGVYEVTPGSDSGVSVERVTEEEASAEEETKKRRGKEEEKEKEEGSVTDEGNAAVTGERGGARGEGKDDDVDYDPFELD